MDWQSWSRPAWAGDILPASAFAYRAGQDVKLKTGEAVHILAVCRIKGSEKPYIVAADREHAEQTPVAEGDIEELVPCTR